MTLEERMDYLEFRMDLLREGSDFTHFIYDCNITREQLDKLYDIMDNLRNNLNNGDRISSARYETEVLSVVDSRYLDYHFCESFAKLLWEDERWEEVFPALYGESVKFRRLFE